MRWRMIALVAAVGLIGTGAQGQIARATVSGGIVEGAAADGIGIFMGIPFAAPPLGALRWAPPAPVRAWSGVRAATAFAPHCMQTAAPPPGGGAVAPVSEDCLYLNIWTPAKSPAERLPVMVWIHGGGFYLGGTSSALFDGTNLAKQGVIVVSLAYRLGGFGFLAHPDLSRAQGGHSGNYGLMDLIAGLKWVRGNIARFGGDPANVTIFGESAGGQAVGMLTQSPLARGLFARAISESGGNFAYANDIADPALPVIGTTHTLRASERLGAMAFAKLGVTSLAQARAAPAADVLRAFTGAGVGWPTYDGRVLIDDPWLLYPKGRFNDVPVLIGSNSDEGGAFARAPVPPETFRANILKQYGDFALRFLAAYPGNDPEQARKSQADMTRDEVFAWPTHAWAKMQAVHGKSPAFVYFFDMTGPDRPHGAFHADEVKYVFGSLGRSPRAKDEAVGATIMGYWINFAKTGDPNGPGLPRWPAFTLATPRYMALGDAVAPIAVPHPEQYQLWQDYYASRRPETAN